MKLAQLKKDKMFLIKKLVHSLNIEGKKKLAGIVFVESKNNIFEEVSESIMLRGGLAHSTHGGFVALFLDSLDSLDLIKSSIEILQKAKSLGVRAKIGINIGEIILEETPSGLVKYASLGNSLSNAKKLAKIENAIAVCDNIHKDVEDKFRFEKLNFGWMIKGPVLG